MTANLLSDAEIARQNAEYFAAERRRDAERLAEYQRECAASWEGRECAARVVVTK